MGDLVADVKDGDAQRGLLARWRARAAAALARRVLWLTDTRRDLAGAESHAPALVVVLGREHYVERRKSYPLQGVRDVAQVLKQELAAEPATLTYIGPLRDDRREVTFYQPRPASLERLGRTAWVVPESLLLAGALGPDDLAEIDRDGFRYFLAPSGESQPASGPIASVELFALAVGLDSGEGVRRWSRADCATRLVPALLRLPPTAWVRFLRGGVRPSLQIAWRPLGILAAVALVAYMASASAYLGLTTHARQNALEGLGPEVEQLLTAQREVERLDAEQRSIGTLLAERRDTYEIWRLLALAWQKGARVTQVQLADARLTLRGNAPVATDVLAALAAERGVADARFASPVTRNGSLEEFAISLTVAAAAPRGLPVAAAAPGRPITVEAPPRGGAGG